MKGHNLQDGLDELAWHSRGTINNLNPKASTANSNEEKPADTKTPNRPGPQ